MGLLDIMENESDCIESIFQSYISSKSKKDIFLFFEGKDDFKYYVSRVSSHIGDKEYGVFHFSNYSETTWFDFAKKIAELSKSKIKINPISTEQYPTPAKRPMRSTMCLDKIENSYNIEPKYWENSLEECMEILLKN